MPVTNNYARFYVIKWNGQMRHRGWPRYEARVMPIDHTLTNSTVVKEDLSRTEVFSLIKKLEEEDVSP